MTNYKRNFNQLFWLMIIVLTSCNNTRLQEQSVVNEGVGVDDIYLRNLLVSEVKSKLGDNYDTINHHNYSIELFYKELGVSFYYKVNSPDSIFAMAFNNDYKGKTKKGFDIRHMKVADMLRIYGPADWVFLESAETIYAHYDSLGIYFAVKPKAPVPDSISTYRVSSYYDSVYNSEKIIEISVGLPGTTF